MFVLTTTPAFAIDDNEIFEFDAEDAHPNPVEEDNPVVPGSEDWYSIIADNAPVDSTTTTFCSEPTVIPTTMGGKEQSPTIFVQGGSKDTLDVSSWLWQSPGNAPDKNDLVTGGAKFYPCPAGQAHCDEGDTILVFGASLFDGTGSHNFGFWFGQENWGITGGFSDPNGCFPNDSSGGFMGNHVNDDILLVVEWNGNEFKELNIFLWDDTAFKNLNQITGGMGAGAIIFRECGDTNGDDDACVMTNKENSFTIDDDNSANPPHWSYQSKFGASDPTHPSVHTVTPGSFYEGFLNLTSTFEKLNIPEPCISSFLVNTRTSTSNTAQLKDWILGDITTCKIDVEKTCRNTGLSDVTGFLFEGKIDITVTNGNVGAFAAGTLSLEEQLSDGNVEGDAGFAAIAEIDIDIATLGGILPGDTVTWCDDLVCSSGSTNAGDPCTADGQCTSGSCNAPACDFPAVNYLTNANGPTNSVDAELEDEFGNFVVAADQVDFPADGANQNVPCEPIPLSPMLDIHKECSTFLNLANSMVKVNVAFNGYACNSGDIPLFDIDIDDPTAGFNNTTNADLDPGVSCTADNNCSVDFTCNAGTCDFTGADCDVDADCTGECKTLTIAPPNCFVNADCNTGVCNTNDTCTADSNTKCANSGEDCAVDADCSVVCLSETSRSFCALDSNPGFNSNPACVAFSGTYAPTDTSPSGETDPGDAMFSNTVTATAPASNNDLLDADETAMATANCPLCPPVVD